MRTGQLMILMLALAICSGCQPLSSPWAGMPYEPPQEVQGPGQTTFAPTPTMLPIRVAPAVDSVSQDAALERFLFQQSESGAGSGSK